MIQARNADTLLIPVTAGNIRNNHISIAGHYTFFPRDVFGQPRRSDPTTGKPIYISLAGLKVVMDFRSHGSGVFVFQAEGRQDFAGGVRTFSICAISPLFVGTGSPACASGRRPERPAALRPVDRLRACPHIKCRPMRQLCR